MTGNIFNLQFVLTSNGFDHINIQVSNFMFYFRWLPVVLVANTNHQSVVVLRGRGWRFVGFVDLVRRFYCIINFSSPSLATATS